MDVKSAFLNGELEEEVYVAQPPGFVVKGHENKVLKLRKALYGLKQAPRAWNLKLDRCLQSLGFKRSPLEYAVYKRNAGDTIQIIGVYVDDLIITGSKIEDIKSFKEQMMKLFEMSDLGLLSYYLGIEVKQYFQFITLCQSSYAVKILEKLGMEGCNPCKIPMETRVKLSKVSDNPPVDAALYRSVIGSLRYLVNSRPDLAYSVGVLSRYMEAPTTTHMAAVKQVLRYVRGTVNFGCCYEKRRQCEKEPIGFSDSDLAGDIDDRKSTIGVIYFLGAKPITWVSQKQRVVALSSCEAEYVAATAAACQGVWLGRMLDELIGGGTVRAVLKVDNKSAIALAKNPVYHERSKHIDTKYHFIHDCVQRGDIAVEHVQTEEQLADILTKPLGRQKFDELRGKIGVRDVKQEKQD